MTIDNNKRNQNTKEDQLFVNIFNHAKDTLHFVLKRRREQFLKDNKKLIDSTDIGMEDFNLVIYLRTLEHMEEQLDFLVHIFSHKSLDNCERWEKEQEEMR